MVFHENSNCIVMNDPQFHQAVTFNAGQTKGLPPTSQKVKEAIETLEKEGILTDDKQWWAIYRVLTMSQFGYPTSKPEFCKVIENMQPEVAHKCNYTNWRSVNVHHLVPAPDKWECIENLSETESKQKKVGLRLLELLA